MSTALTLQSATSTHSAKIFDYTSDEDSSLHSSYNNDTLYLHCEPKEEPKWEDDLFNNEDLSENFADKMLDLEFMYLDNCGNSTSSPKISFPTVTRKRPCPPARGGSTGPRGVVVKREKRFLSDYRPLRTSEEDQFIDIINDDSKWEHAQALPQTPPLPKIKVEQSDFENYKPYHTTTREQHTQSHTPHYNERSYSDRSYSFSHYNHSRSLYRETTVRNGEEGELSPKEQMTLLRSGCTCQARNTGKSTHLWEFLLEMLADKRMRSLIAWTGHAREFKVVNSREVAREWGNRKNKPHMNFDKMSRAMRYYYKKKILTHGSKQRLVYSFCHHAICPHYEKIINLALKTRPKLHSDSTTATEPGSAGSTPTKDSSPPPAHYEQRRAPKVKTSLSQKHLSEKFLTAKLSSYRLNKKQPPQRPIGSTLTRPSSTTASNPTRPANVTRPAYQRPIGSTLTRPSASYTTPVRERNLFSHPFLNSIN